MSQIIDAAVFRKTGQRRPVPNLVIMAQVEPEAHRSTRFQIVEFVKTNDGEYGRFTGKTFEWYQDAHAYIKRENANHSD